MGLLRSNSCLAFNFSSIKFWIYFSSPYLSSLRPVIYFQYQSISSAESSIISCCSSSVLQSSWKRASKRSILACLCFSSDSSFVTVISDERRFDFAIFLTSSKSFLPSGVAKSGLKVVSKMVDYVFCNLSCSLSQLLPNFNTDSRMTLLKDAKLDQGMKESVFEQTSDGLLFKIVAFDSCRFIGDFACQVDQSMQSTSRRVTDEKKLCV